MEVLFEDIGAVFGWCRLKWRVAQEFVNFDGAKTLVKVVYRTVIEWIRVLKYWACYTYDKLDFSRGRHWDRRRR